MPSKYLFIVQIGEDEKKFEVSETTALKAAWKVIDNEDPDDEAIITVTCEAGWDGSHTSNQWKVKEVEKKMASKDYYAKMSYEKKKQLAVVEIIKKPQKRTSPNRKKILKINEVKGNDKKLNNNTPKSDNHSNEINTNGIKRHTRLDIISIIRFGLFPFPLYYLIGLVPTFIVRYLFMRQDHPHKYLNDTFIYSLIVALIICILLNALWFKADSFRYEYEDGRKLKRKPFLDPTEPHRALIYTASILLNLAIATIYLWPVLNNYLNRSKIYPFVDTQYEWYTDKSIGDVVYNKDANAFYIHCSFSSAGNTSWKDEHLKSLGSNILNGTPYDPNAGHWETESYNASAVFALKHNNEDGYRISESDKDDEKYYKKTNYDVNLMYYNS